MGTTLMGVDGVCVGVNTLVVAGGPLHRNFDREVFLFGLRLDRDDLVVNDLYLLGCV